MSLDRESDVAGKVAAAKRPVPWFAIGIVAFLGLLIAPDTRQVVRMEFAGAPLFAYSFFFPEEKGIYSLDRFPPKTLSEQNDACILRAARSLAIPPTENDDSPKTPVSAEDIARYDAARSSCTNQPAIDALLLNRLSVADIELARDAEEAYLSTTRPIAPAKKQPMNSPEILARWQEAANRGATLDPDNAYFPLIQAIGLFIQKRDDEAFAALHQAARKPYFNDYAWAEADAEDRLIKASPLGIYPAVSRSLAYLSVSFPAYAKMRSAARVAIALTAQKESRGDHDRGFAIRHDVARIGTRIRLDSRTWIGSTTGFSLTAIASSRPNGAPVPDRARTNSDERQAESLSQYITYLNTHGYKNEATWYLAERKQAYEMKRVTEIGRDRTFNDIYETVLASGFWAVSAALLLNILTAPLLGFAARGIVQSIRQEKPLRLTVVGWLGMAGGAFILFLTGAILNLIFDFDRSSSIGGMAISGLGWMTFFGIGVLLPSGGKGNPTPSFKQRFDAVWRNTPTNVGKLLIAYALCTAIVGGLETYYGQRLNRQFAHEGRYYTELIGEKWQDEIKLGPIKQADKP